MRTLTPTRLSYLRVSDRRRKHAEIGPESFGIVVCRSVCTVPGILGLVWPSVRPKSGSKTKISGPVSSAEPVGPRVLGRGRGLRLPPFARRQLHPPVRLNHRYGSNRSPPVGLRPARGPIFMFYRLKSGPEANFPARKHMSAELNLPVWPTTGMA